MILGVAGSLERLVAGDPDKADLEALSACVTFIRLYADACHHAKEEDLLFPALADRGLPSGAGPVAVMLAEHEQGRALTRGMAGALERLGAGDGGAYADLRAAAVAFVDLITGHIAKEDGILFNMADRLIGEAACQSLTDSYAALAGARFEGYSKQDLEALAGEIAAAAAA